MNTLSVANYFRGCLALKIVVNLFLAPDLPPKKPINQKWTLSQWLTIFGARLLFRTDNKPKIVLNLFLAPPKANKPKMALSQWLTILGAKPLFRGPAAQGLITFFLLAPKTATDRQTNGHLRYYI